MKTLITAALATLLFSGSGLAISQTKSHSAHHMIRSASTSKMAMMKMCNAMMAEKANSKSKMKAMDAKLDSLVATMDSATGDDKITAMSAVLKEMVSQRTMMRSMMDTMDSKMMGHMMDHMKAGKGMMNCPMMHSMMGMKRMTGMKGSHGTKAMKGMPGMKGMKN